MKRNYTLYIPLFLIILFGCSKDFLKKYDKRIIGTWRITEVNRTGFGGSTDGLIFKEGTFIFNEGGDLTYITPANVPYQGTWDIDIKTAGDESIRTFQIVVVNYASQQLLTQLYDNISFAGTDHFKARIQSGFHSYVTHFRR